MQNKIINQNGIEHDLDEYYLSSNDQSFKRFIEAEVYKKVADINKAPDYLAICRKYGFSWEEHAGAGLVQYNYKAELIMQLLMMYAEDLVQNIGFPILRVRGSNIWDMSHPEVQAYASLFGDRLFNINMGSRKAIMSYDASYPQFNLSGKGNANADQLPYGHFSISDCYRYEQSGECMLLYRQRRFFMPDLHPYFKDIDEAFKWYPAIERQIMKGMKEINREVYISAEVSSVENYEKYRSELCDIARNAGKDIIVQIREDNKEFYWVLNVDYKIIDKLGQSREIACIQIDIGNAPRLGISYRDGNENKHPVIIHAAVPGGIERFLYAIFDNFKDSMPLWLSPVQLRLLPVNDSFVAKCEEIVSEYRHQLRIDIDDRSESVGKKIREAHQDLIPHFLVIGDREAENDSDMKSSIVRILESVEGKPFIPLNFPSRKSRQI